MSCFHPRCLFYSIDPATGELLTRYSNLEFFKVSDSEKLKYYKVSPVPCGSCIGCKLDRSRQWADRMCIELDHSKVAVFATLTYNDYHLPMVEVPANNDAGYDIVPTLSKSDLQKFFKRLRYYYPDKEIRYYSAGEYGSQTHRPHYHAVIFGISLSDFDDIFLVGKNEFGQNYYSSSTFENVWSNGFIGLSEFSWQTAAYVARYVQKKAYADGDNPYTSFENVQDEFALMSRRPGIGGYFFLDNPDYNPEVKFSFSDRNGVRSSTRDLALPRYLLDKFAVIDPDRYVRILEDRRTFANDRLLLELQNTDLGANMYLSQKEQILIARSKLLKRR